MKTWVRHLIRNTRGVLFGEFPQALVFGGPGAEGTSIACARADHVHPLPPEGETDPRGIVEILDLLRINNWIFDDFDDFQSSLDVGPFTFSGEFTASPFDFLAENGDRRGNTGARGLVIMRTDGDPVSNPAAVVYRQINYLGGDSFGGDPAHLFPRMTLFEMRVRPVMTRDEFGFCNMLIGAFQSGPTMAVMWDILKPLANGVFFSSSTTYDAPFYVPSNWIATAMSSVTGLSTSVDTGIPVLINTDGTVAFQTFRIYYDTNTGTAHFYIRYVDETGAVVNDGNVEVAAISENIPERVAGWGAVTQSQGTDIEQTNRNLSVDSFFLSGIREFF